MRAPIVLLCTYQTLSQGEVLGSDVEPPDGQDKNEVFGFPYSQRKLSWSAITIYMYTLIYIYICIHYLTIAFKTTGISALHYK